MASARELMQALKEARPTLRGAMNDKCKEFAEDIDRLSKIEDGSESFEEKTIRLGQMVVTAMTEAGLSSLPSFKNVQQNVDALNTRG